MHVFIVLLCFVFVLLFEKETSSFCKLVTCTINTCYSLCNFSVFDLNYNSHFVNLGPIAGGVDEETFIRAFEDVPKIQIYSAKEMEDHLNSMRIMIQDPNNDWAKRAETVTKIPPLH